MNKIILLITLLCTTNIFAESIEDQVQRKMDMQTLSTGLEMVQKGILYNNPSLTKTGISMIKKGQKKLIESHGEDLKKYLPMDSAFAFKFAKSAAKRIQDYSDELTEYLNSKKDYMKISASYTHIMNECAGCHLRIRKW